MGGVRRWRAVTNRAASMDGAMDPHVIEVLIPADELPEGELVARVIGSGTPGLDVLALRRGEQLRVWHNVCPHAGRRLDYAPGRFLMHEGRLVCAAHGAQFELGEGRCVEGPGRGGGLAPLLVTPVNGGWLVRTTG